MGKEFKPFTLFLCLLIIAFMVFGSKLINNGIESSLKEGKNSVENRWKGVITIWDYPRPYPEGGSGFGWIRERIQEFERRNPGIFIELHTLDWERGTVQLDLAVQSGTYPDIAPVGTNFGYASRGVLEPLDEYFTPRIKEKYLDYALKAVTYEERIWGIPVYGAAPVMLLNLELFQKRGVDPPEGGRWTYSEFAEALKKLTFDENGDGKIDVYGFHSFVLNGYTNLGGILLSDGWELFNPVNSRYMVDTPQALSGLKKVVDLALEYRVVPEDFGISSPDEAWKAFAIKKKIAVYPAGLWAVGKLESLKNQGKGFEFGVAEYPIGEVGSSVTVSDGVAAYGIFKQESAQKKKICLEFLDYIAGSFDHREIMRRRVIQVRRDSPAYLTPIVDPGTIKIVPKMKNWSYVEDILNSHIRQAILGKETPEAALKAAQKEIDAVQKGQ